MSSNLTDDVYEVNNELRRTSKIIYLGISRSRLTCHSQLIDRLFWTLTA